MSKYWRGLTIIASLLVLQAVMQTACESATDSDSEFVVLSVSPEDGADSIPLQPTIRIAFSNWIDSDRLSSLHIDIEGSSHDSLTVSRSSDGGVRRGYLIIRPTQRLPGDSVLSVTLKAGLRLVLSHHSRDYLCPAARTGAGSDRCVTVGCTASLLLQGTG
jgi:hypothetical protein